MGLPVPPVLVTGEEVTHGKPDPQGYLQAATRLGVAAEHGLVFEDAPTGIAAGQAAGMRVIAVATTCLLEAFTPTAEAVQTLADVQLKAVRTSTEETGHHSPGVDHQLAPLARRRRSPSKREAARREHS